MKGRGFIIKYRPFLIKLFSRNVQCAQLLKLMISTESNPLKMIAKEYTKPKNLHNYRKEWIEVFGNNSIKSIELTSWCDLVVLAQILKIVYCSGIMGCWSKIIIMWELEYDYETVSIQSEVQMHVAPEEHMWNSLTESTLYIGMSCPSWQWHRTGSRWFPGRTLPVAPLWCDLGFVPNSRGNKAAANLRPTNL